MAVYSFELFRAHRDEGARLPPDLEIGLTCRSLDESLTDFQRLITQAATKNEAVDYVGLLMDYEQRIGALVDKALRRAEGFDYQGSAA